MADDIGLRLAGLSLNALEESVNFRKKMNRHIGSKRRCVVIHDAHGLKNFWEEIIESQTKQKEVEDSRLTRSALTKLRHEWAQRLEGRMKMLHKTSENPNVQTSLLPIETFQPMHKTAA